MFVSALPSDLTRVPSRPAGCPPVLEARLFGELALRVDGRPVPRWKGPRGISVLRMLLASPGRRCSRDLLLEEFWPGVSPEQARNRLQVAVSGLRRSLLEVTSLALIEFADGGYRIDPRITLVLDTERFEQELATAAGLERAGDPAAAAAAYRQAAQLYRGEFAADAPFERWTVLARESLRIGYLDALDRLSRIEWRSGAIGDCIATGHRMLETDPCREDAHQLLMRCYAEQGRIYQVHRQYDFCTRMLAATLDCAPAADTTRLYRYLCSAPAAAPQSSPVAAGGPAPEHGRSF
jgi:DNA-binding SARP family transcriptional activator